MQFDRPEFKKIKKYKRIGILTSGGDAPGMNASIRALVRYGIHHGIEIVGIKRGYSGILLRDFKNLQARSVANIIQRGGTILKSNRFPDWKKKSVRKKASQILKEHQIEAVIVIGGDGSLTGAYHFWKETGIPMIGLPGTIDNDIPGTDLTIGFDTAVNTGLEAIDRIRDTANSHERIFLIEVMGRHSGHIAQEVGLAAGAESIWIPESPITSKEIIDRIKKAKEKGKLSSILVIAEGSSGSQGRKIHQELLKKGLEPRLCTLGHIQRGGSPSALDRNLATLLSVTAIDALLGGKTHHSIGTQKGTIVLTPLSRISRPSRSKAKDSFELTVKLAN
ncbi:MAG: 6-phosphofructokinase [Bdellovibrionaceae bacterium]|nr:6-phosphofructokinase [Pseudobdellovibrionaceae bacterium]